MTLFELTKQEKNKRIIELFKNIEASDPKAKNELTEILENCTTEELCLITDITKTTLTSLKKYIK